MLNAPWARVKNPTPIPEGVDVVMLEEMDDKAFAELLRDNLLPRTPETRASWERLWDVLYDDDDLADRAGEVLDDFSDATENFLREDPGPDPTAAKRARKFLLLIEDAGARLSLDRAALPSHVAVRRLVYAITRHRALTRQRGEVTDLDEQLWRTLSRLGLDPTEQK